MLKRPQAAPVAVHRPADAREGRRYFSKLTNTPIAKATNVAPGAGRHPVAGRPAEEEQPNASPQDQKEYDRLVKNVIAVSLAPAPRSPVHARA